MFDYKKNVVQIKYLISYIIILMIPMIILLYAFFNDFIVRGREEVVQRKTSELKLEHASLENVFYQVETIANQIIHNPKFRRSKLQDYEVLPIELNDSLRDYKLFNNFIEDILFHVKGSNTIYSTRSVYNLNNYIDRICTYENWTQYDFENDIKNLEKSVIIPVDEVNCDGVKTKLLTIVYPDNTFDSTIIIQLNYDKISSLFQDSYENINTILFNEKEEIVYSFKDIDLEVPLIIDLNISIGTFSSEVLDDEYIYAYMPSSYFNLTYMRIISEKDIFNETIQMRNKIIISFIMILVLGSLLIGFFMRLNYKPVKKMFEVVNKKYNSYISSEKDNSGMGIVINTMDNIFDDA